MCGSIPLIFESLAETIGTISIFANIEIVPMVSAKLSKINGIDPHTYIDRNNDSHWVIQGDRRVSWVDEIPTDNPLTAGEWWDLSKPDKLQFIRFT